MDLKGIILFVGEVRYRRDSKPLVVQESSYQEKIYVSPRLVVGRVTKVVNGSGMDSAADLVMLERGEYEKELLRRDKEFDRGESDSSDRTVTWDYEKKESDENKLILEENVVESKGAMEQSGSLAANESVCSSGVGIFKVVKEGSHDKQLGSKGKEEGANPIEMVVD
ncbi:hypothetical protein PIB30_093243 [Stylosanthes scabra]|uniref:Uncharacterized protein n=1 Tax=Stylosanthes scabra TaxID=79078 RepID=A0ABU6RVC2_9FABA|nr:hypothetical protein [Stylosanthes scabra]